MDEWITQAEVGRRLGVTRQRVCNLFRNYDGARNKAGKVEASEALQWYEEHTQQARRKRHHADTNGKRKEAETSTNGNGKAPTYLESQARKEAAMADLKEMEVSQKRGELFPLQEGVRVVSKLAASVKESLESMVERLPAKLSTMKEKREIKALLKAEVAKSLKSLQDIKFK